MKKKKISETKIGKYFHEIIKIIKTPEMGLLPGQLAFYMLLSLVPLVTLACYAANLFELDYTKIVHTLDILVPGGVGTFLPTLSEGGISLPMIIIIIWMLYIASNGCNTIIIISNNIYGIRQSTWLKRRIKAIFMTIMIVVLVIALLLVSVYQMRTENMIQDITNLSNIDKIKSYLQFPVMFVVLFLFLRVFYNFAPDRMRDNTNITVGTLFASIGITLLTLLYSYLARNMINYELLYGGLANVALLMAWLYCISFVFVIGLALNYGEEKEKITKES
jgi:membrane protein